MFKSKKAKSPESQSKTGESLETDSTPKTKKKTNWLKISVIVNGVIILGVAVALGAMAILHQSDTNPQFCGTCHIMDEYVESYTSGTNMDSVHAKAGVQCKECHSAYGIPEEIESGFKFVTGNYDPTVPQRKFDDDMCTQCHISLDFVADQTDYLRRNPHRSHTSDLKCRTCHISHGEQIDYCSQCHDNGGQRMIGDEIVPRVDNPYDDYPDSGGTSNH
jgi:nitrate/TMAO reductase-like tetraheme cytochrome c subunit